MDREFRLGVSLAVPPGGALMVVPTLSTTALALTYALIGVPAVLTLLVVLLRALAPLPALLLVWVACLAVLTWAVGTPPCPLPAGIPPIIGDPYLWLLILLVVGAGNLGKQVGGTLGIYVLGVASLGVGAALFWLVFPLFAGWATTLSLDERWSPLVTTVFLVLIIGASSSVALSVCLGGVGRAASGAVMTFAVALTYVELLMYYQITTGVVVQHSVGILYALVVTFYGFLVLIVVVIGRAIKVTGPIALGLAALAEYYLFAFVMRLIVLETTGQELLISGWWPF